eukprot:4196296-Ditylum_brightwellii.AAC.1
MAPDKETMDGEANPHDTSQNLTCTACRIMHLSRSDGVQHTWGYALLNSMLSMMISLSLYGPETILENHYQMEESSWPRKTEGATSEKD